MPTRTVQPEPIRVAAATYLAAWTLLVEALAAHRIQAPRPVERALVRTERWVRGLVES